MASCFSCFKPWRDDDLQKERLKAFKELEDIQSGAGNTHVGAEADIAAKLITTKVAKPDGTGADGQLNPETSSSADVDESPTQQTAEPSDAATQAADGNADTGAADGPEQSGTADPANRHSPDQADQPASPGPGDSAGTGAEGGEGDDAAAVCGACGSPCASPRSPEPDCSSGGGSTATAGATTTATVSSSGRPCCSSCGAVLSGGGAGPSEGGGGGLPAVPEAPDAKPDLAAAGSSGGKPRHSRCYACSGHGSVDSPVASPRAGGCIAGETPGSDAAARRPPLSAASSSRSLVPPPSVGERTPATPKLPRTPGSSRYGWGGGAYIAGGPSGGVRMSAAFPSPQRSGSGAKATGMGRAPSASAAVVGGAPRRNPTGSPGIGSYGAGAVAAMQRGGSGRLYSAASAGVVGSRNTPTPPPPGVYTSASTRLALHDVLHHRGSRGLGASGRSGFSVNSLSSNIDFRPAWRY
ncbi:hypothetical protein PLESTB_001419800 [Pleodorina starrii]|uniref:Uncharacterized protein n=1 Tax=Pleodorina starrii TaxID=330485 RepID=A0A9W6BW60_9CHLO|nr:hypothetical protein PLESTM_001381700 [Pleodorina starrii]GLC58942.1 hypothetical protein PLESTB_001419800 [Pleodorina starrii]GLC65103.1 hypothetical protein PLESTF_000246900 [Pleodorina starrii]